MSGFTDGTQIRQVVDDESAFTEVQRVGEASNAHRGTTYEKMGEDEL